MKQPGSEGLCHWTLASSAMAARHNRPASDEDKLLEPSFSQPVPIPERADRVFKAGRLTFAADFDSANLAAVEATTLQNVRIVSSNLV